MFLTSVGVRESCVVAAQMVPSNPISKKKKLNVYFLQWPWCSCDDGGDSGDDDNDRDDGDYGDDDDHDGDDDTSDNNGDGDDGDDDGDYDDDAIDYYHHIYSNIPAIAAMKTLPDATNRSA